MMSGCELVECVEGVRVGVLKYPGAGKKIASVLDALDVDPTCIWRANLANWRQMTYAPSSISALYWKAKAPSST